MSVTIVSPAAGATVNVGDEFSFPGTTGPGTLCSCEIRISCAQSTFFSAVFLHNRQGTTEPSDAETLGTSGRWGKVFSINTFVTGNLDKTAHRELWAFRVPVPAADNNVIKAIALYFVPGPGGMMVPLRDIDVQGFKGKRSPGCGEAPAPQPPVVIPPHLLRHPSQQDGNWLLYEGLGLSPLDGGNVLMRNGEPLKAHMIAASVPRVAWWYGSDPPHLVNRAVGTYTAGDYTDRFRSVMRDAICVCQDLQPEEARGVVASESRDKPDLIALNGQDVIRVLPNVSYLHMQTLTGSFDLWVKVID